MFIFFIVLRVVLTFLSKIDIIKGWLLEMVFRRYLLVLEVDFFVWLVMKEIYNEIKFYYWF